MMPGFGEKFSKFASGTKNKAQVLVETNKLNSAIHKEEAAIQATYTEIGKSYFEAYKDDTDIPAQFREMVDRILGHMQQIEELKEKIIEVKGIKICPGCGSEVENESAFCNKCGHRFEAEAPSYQAAPSPIPQAVPSPVPQSIPQPEASSIPQATVQPAAAPQDETRTCSSCGTAVAQGVLFCGNCGQRIEEKPAATVKACSACGSPLAEGILFCGQCGHKQE